MNLIIPFKDRTIDPAQPVKVYRNLNKPGVVYSIQQAGLIVGHATELHLKDVTFTVNEAGRQRVLKEKRKNVHAFIVGHVTEHPEPVYGAKVKYNPYKGPTFRAAAMSIISDDEGWFEVKGATAVKISAAGVRAGYAFPI